MELVFGMQVPEKGLYIRQLQSNLVYPKVVGANFVILKISVMSLQDVL